MSDQPNNAIPPKQPPRRMGGPMGGMGGPMGGMMGGAKAKNFKGTLGKLVQYMRPFWISIIIVIVFAILSTVFSIMSPKILGNMTNQVVSDYINMTVYDQTMARLPAGTTLAPGTTGAQILKSAPAAALQKIPADQLAKIQSLDFSHRPGVNFDTLGKTAMLLLFQGCLLLMLLSMKPLNKYLKDLKKLMLLQMIVSLM